MASTSIFSFFAGAGFLDLGFENVGHDVVYVNEYHEPFLQGYRHSRQIMKIDPPIYGYDAKSIEDVDATQLNERIAKEREANKIVGFIGGPPCPDFSVGGKNRGHIGENGRLSRTYIDLIRLAKPDFFLFENVRGLYRTKKHREFFEALKESLSQSGYTLYERLINSIEYGAPQDRDRIILLGFLNKELSQNFNWSERRYLERSAFSFDWPDMTPLGAGSSSAPNSIPIELTVQHWFDRNDVVNHPNARHVFRPRAGLAKFATLPEGDDSKKSYKRLHRWRYSPTAAYGNNEVHIHPYEPRRISVAEALAIQSLPIEFELPQEMTLTNMFKTVGNGVPYLAALGLAKSIQKHLESNDASDSSKSSQSDSRSAA